MTPDRTFEDRLLAELRRVVAARPAPAAVPPVTAAHPPRPRRARRLAGAAAVAGTLAVAVAVGLSSGDRADPAYAVKRLDDGTVTVEISSLRDAEGLERKLRAAGIPAVVDYAPAGKACREPRGTPATPTGRHSIGVRVRSDGAASFTIGGSSLRPGTTLVLTSSLADGPMSLRTALVSGKVAPCELVDADTVPLPPGKPGPPPAGAVSGEAGLSQSAGRDVGPSTHTGP